MNQFDTGPSSRRDAPQINPVVDFSTRLTETMASVAEQLARIVADPGPSIQGHNYNELLGVMAALIVCGFDDGGQTFRGEKRLPPDEWRSRVIARTKSQVHALEEVQLLLHPALDELERSGCLSIKREKGASLVLEERFPKDDPRRIVLEAITALYSDRIVSTSTDVDKSTPPREGGRSPLATEALPRTLQPVESPEELAQRAVRRQALVRLKRQVASTIARLDRVIAPLAKDEAHTIASLKALAWFSQYVGHRSVLVKPPIKPSEPCEFAPEAERLMQLREAYLHLLPKIATYMETLPFNPEALPLKSLDQRLRTIVAESSADFRPTLFAAANGAAEAYSLRYHGDRIELGPKSMGNPLFEIFVLATADLDNYLGTLLVSCAGDLMFDNRGGHAAALIETLQKVVAEFPILTDFFLKSQAPGKTAYDAALTILGELNQAIEELPPRDATLRPSSAELTAGAQIRDTQWHKVLELRAQLQTLSNELQTVDPKRRA